MKRHVNVHHFYISCLWYMIQCFCWCIVDFFSCKPLKGHFIISEFKITAVKCLKIFHEPPSIFKLLVLISAVETKDVLPGWGCLALLLNLIEWFQMLRMYSISQREPIKNSLNSNVFLYQFLHKFYQVNTSIIRVYSMCVYMSAWKCKI